MATAEPTTRDNDGEAVHVLRVNGGIDLIPVAHGEPEEYNISWIGLRELTGITGITTIEFLDGDDRVGFGLSFDAQQVFMLTSGNVPSWSFGGVFHEVTIVVDPGINQFSLSFHEEGCEADDDCHEANNVAFADPDFETIERVRISGSEYFIADFSIFVE